MTVSALKIFSSASRTSLASLIGLLPGVVWKTLADDDVAADDGRQDLGRPRDRRRPPVHRPAPRARGLEPAGLRGSARGRAHGASRRPDARDGRPQRAHVGALPPE